MVYRALGTYIAARLAEFDAILHERKGALDGLAAYIQMCLNDKKPCWLTFICTHNSRRSQLAQVWAATAAAHYGIAGVELFSGGTEVTAFNPRAVAALERAGLTVTRITDGVNPAYQLRHSDGAVSLKCFSKEYNQAPNPRERFCAVMMCSHADGDCPIVHGCSKRIAVTHDDPKVADGTPEEQATYDERCRQIAREMLYVFSRVGALAEDQRI